MTCLQFHVEQLKRFFRAQVDLAMTAQPARPLGADDGRAGGLAEVQHVIAVSSCKGGALAGVFAALVAVLAAERLVMSGGMASGNLRCCRPNSQPNSRAAAVWRVYQSELTVVRRRGQVYCGGKLGVHAGADGRPHWHSC